MTELQQQPSLAGRVVVAFHIDEQGAVSSARVQDTTLNNERVESCVARQIRRWRFTAPPGEQVDVDYAITFAPAVATDD